MKKPNGLYSISLNIPKTASGPLTGGILNLLHSLIRIFCLTFISSLLSISLATAQNSIAFDGTPGHIKTSGIRSDNESKIMKRALRKERESTKAVENIPQSVFDQFNMQFPKATNAEWSVPGEYPEVNFTLNHRSMVADYDYSGKLIGSGFFLPYNKIPKKGRERIARDYKDYTPVQSIFYDDNEDNDTNANLFGIPIQMDGYFVQLKKGNNQIVVQVEKDGEVSYFSNMR